MAGWRWVRHGLVFRPGDHVLPNGCREFAQAPQCLVFDDFVRIYFSSRASDEVGKYLSHVCYVDMDQSLRAVRTVCARVAIEPGGLGCFDEHGIFPMNVVRHGDRILAFTTGWSRRSAVSIETGIGLAESQDAGETFVRHGTGPVLTASLREPFLVGDGFVLVVGGLWHMWYIYGVRWLPESDGRDHSARVYKIGHAVSPDGVNWSKDGRRIVPDRLGDDECQALPTVACVGGRHHMVFCYREASGFRGDRGRSYRLGHAWSDDLVVWHRDDAALGLERPETGFDSDMMCYPHLLQLDGRLYLLYNGNEFGRHGFGLAELERADEHS